MKIVKGYQIRCQGLGIIAQRVYFEPPPQADLDAWHEEDQRLNGHKKRVDEDGNVTREPREMWIKVVTTEIAVPDAAAQFFEPCDKPEPLPEPRPELVMEATAIGHVINP